MAPSSGELWGHHLMPQTILVDCLLPTGVIIPVKCFRDSVLEKIKKELWKEARNYPLSHLLKKPSSYVFVSITQDAEREEFYDENRRLCDLKLFLPVLKLVAPEGNKEEKILNSEIGIALGFSVHEFDDVKGAEVIEFRRNIFSFVSDIFQERDSRFAESQALYKFPPEIESSPELPQNLEEKLENGMIRVAVWSLTDAMHKQKYTIAVKITDLPEQIIKEAIYKRIKHSSQHRSQEEKLRVVEEHKSSYVLKVGGSDQHLFVEVPLSQYKYIRTCVAKNIIPNLMLMSKRSIYDTLPPQTFHIPAYMRKPLPTNKPSKEILLWEYDSFFRFQVIAVSSVNLREADAIFVRVGIFHGTESICEVLETKQIVYSATANPRWDEWLEFDISQSDLPRAAKLCFSLCTVKRRKNRSETTMLFWVNINIFDYMNHMITDELPLEWRSAHGVDGLLNPFGESGPNPSRDHGFITLKFERHSQAVTYPSLDDFKRYQTEVLMKLDFERHNISFVREKLDINEDDKSLLKNILSRDPLAEISEQEKELLWKLRRHCLKIPDILPRLLDAVNWNSRDDLTQLYLLLEEWPNVSPHTALELLDCKFPDPTVRKRAVEWLNFMCDEDLSQYLLQLVQTLKYEPYIDSPLARLLLRRSLLNRKIGHFFFWHLRAELHSQNLNVRFGLLLEAFCRGLGPYLKELIKQVEALDKLTTLTDSMKERPQDTAKERLKFLSEQMQQKDYLESLQFFHSPLENSILFGKLVFENCRVMDTAKKPLWLEWSNPDQLADVSSKTNAIIFKNGDDLRQDMLTLQVIRIMDNIWLTEGMDLKMTPYSCLATGNQVGVIEVVYDAKTVYQIQRKASRLAAIQVDSSQLFKWVREHNKHTLDQAIEKFTLSCAGYCVATFILGIGDRHPDNIMVKSDGQIFHIDFGHFLGHMKKKFGINRERVPFVLTDDFLCVISKGKEAPKKSEEFMRFQELCGKAYLALRRHSNLLMTLFMMMLPTGIKELQSIDDIYYLRETLAVEKSEQEALEYFQNMFCEAYGGAWTTKLDWFFHSIAHY